MLIFSELGSLSFNFENFILWLLMWSQNDLKWKAWIGRRGGRIGLGSCSCSSPRAHTEEAAFVGAAIKGGVGELVGISWILEIRAASPHTVMKFFVSKNHKSRCRPDPYSGVWPHHKAFSLPCGDPTKYLSEWMQITLCPLESQEEGTN